MPTYTAATNPAYYDGLAQGWTVQSTQSEGGGDQSLTNGGSAPTTGLGGTGPASQGLSAWTFGSMTTVAGTTNPATGTQFASKFYWPGGNINSIWVHPTAVATTQAHGWLAIYDGTGVKWAASADLGSTPLVTGSNKVAVASAPVPVPSGYYYVYGAFVFSVGTYTLGKYGGATVSTAASAMNGNLSAGSWIFAPTPPPSPPSRPTLPGVPAGQPTYIMAWFGVS